MSSIIEAMDYGLMFGVQFPGGARDFSLLHAVQPGTEAYPYSFLITGYRGLFYLWIKRPEREAYKLPSSSIEVKNDPTSSPQ
jgi:hypothetical protein